MVGSVLFLFVVPTSLHVTQMIMPDFMSTPGYRNGTATLNKNVPFPSSQVTLDVLFFIINRLFSLPIFFVFLYMMVFLCCEVEKFKHELVKRMYPNENEARNKAKLLKKLIRDTQKAFSIFLALYIATLLLASALEIFSIVEKVETVILGNHTIYCIPASATATNLQTLDIGAQNIMAIPHR